jgi:hypothetical protein
MPALFPGFSRHNMNAAAPVNEVPWRGCRFFWGRRQGTRHPPAATVHAAMFEAVDEDAAMFEVAAGAVEAPTAAATVTLTSTASPCRTTGICASHARHS